MSALAKPLMDLIHVWHEWTCDSKILQKGKARFQETCPVQRQVLLLFHCQYFGKKFSEMFTEWSSTKHVIFVQTPQFHWLAWQLRLNLLKICKTINSSEAIRVLKLKIFKTVHSISRYKNIVCCCCCFFCRCLCTLVAVAVLLQYLDRTFLEIFVE